MEAAPSAESCPTVTNSSRVDWSGIAVARSSFHAIYIFVYIYILHLMGPVVAVYHMAWHHCQAIAGGEIPRRGPSSSSPLAVGGHSCFIKILQQKHTLETPTAKLRSRWPESS